MKLQLTVYLNEADRTDEDVPVHEVIVRRMLHEHIAGATVYRGIMGYGRHSRVHRTRLFGVSDDRPLTIVAIDDAERIRAFLPELRTLLTEGMMTLHQVEIV